MTKTWLQRAQENESARKLLSVPTTATSDVKSDTKSLPEGSWVGTPRQMLNLQQPNTTILQAPLPCLTLGKGSNVQNKVNTLGQNQITQQLQAILALQNSQTLSNLTLQSNVLAQNQLKSIISTQNSLLQNQVLLNIGQPSITQNFSGLCKQNYNSQIQCGSLSDSTQSKNKNPLMNLISSINSNQLIYNALQFNTDIASVLSNKLMPSQINQIENKEYLPEKQIDIDSSVVHDPKNISNSITIDKKNVENSKEQSVIQEVPLSLSEINDNTSIRPEDIISDTISEVSQISRAATSNFAESVKSNEIIPPFRKAEAILDHAQQKDQNCQIYLIMQVKWKGESESSWEHFDNFVKEEPHMIQEYLIQLEELSKMSNQKLQGGARNKCGHINVKAAGKCLCKNCYNKLYKQLKSNVVKFDCPHRMSENGRKIKPYMMNMCKKCCAARGIFKSYAWKCEHKHRSHYVKGYCSQCYKSKFENPRTKVLQKQKYYKRSKKFECPHVNSKDGRNIQPYKNGMCKQCCWEKGIFKSYATKCEHTDRRHQGKGLCSQCYWHWHSKNQESENQTNLNLTAKELSEAYEAPLCIQIQSTTTDSSHIPQARKSSLKVQK